MESLENLKSMGLKVTAPRLKILNIFQTSPQRHLSAEDIFKKLIISDSDIGLATVYRVLTQFEQAGILLRNQFEGGRACYELKEGEHHDHLLCLDCGRVEEFFDAGIEQRQKEIALAKGFKIADHSLSIYAHCSKENCEHSQSHVQGGDEKEI